MNEPVRRCLLGAAVVVSWGACSSGVEPHIRRCTAADAVVTLSINEYVSIDPGADSGCVVFPATTASPAEYLIVPQLTSGIPGQRALFQLGGDTILPAPAASIEPSGELSVAEAFHRFLRLGDERRSWGFALEIGTGLRLQTSSTAGPPAQNSLRSFMVCATTDCKRFDRVTARVRTVKRKVVIYVDTLAPAGGLDSAALDGVATEFDQRLYGIDTAAFGLESDIDSNSVVLVLMTNTVNKLITKTACSRSGFVAGFFFGADLDPAFRTDQRSNKGEVFYSIVADPAGTLSCAHPASHVETFVPVTFIHEFQHMISFNQHVLVRGGGGEVLWLNEGLSHYAEELGGRSYALSSDARITDCTVGDTQCGFYSGNLSDAYDYLSDSTGIHFLLPTEGIGSLAERGAAWLFVRYTVDRYAASATMAGWNAVTLAMVGTAQTGAENIASVTGDPFATVVSRWVLANYVTDQVSSPPELVYDSWDLHAVFASLNKQSAAFGRPYPLVPPVRIGRTVKLSGTLRAGSGIYLRATQPAGDPGFTLSFTAPSGAPLDPATGPRLNVMRLQ